MKFTLIHFLASLFALVCGTDAIKFRCDYIYNPSIQAWHKYHVIPATWSDARLMCTLEGGILASPTTPAIKEVMKTTVNGAGALNIFTGFNAMFSKGGFFTVNGISLEHIEHNWAQSEPSNQHNEENCLALDIEGNLLDVPCDEPHTYMCYRELQNVEATICGTPDPEYNYDKRTNKCYKFHKKPRNFERAHFTCSAEGGHLAIINNEAEASVLRELFAKYPAIKMTGNFWKDVAFVGFHNWNEGGDWRTIHGQTLEEAGYARFSPGEPNNSTTGEYCGSIYRNALFNDLWCNKAYAFICEKWLEYPAVCDNGIPVVP